MISKLCLTWDVPPPQSTLLCTTLYSSVVDNYLDTYHLTPLHMNPAAIQHTIDTISLASLETRLRWILRSTWDVLTWMECPFWMFSLRILASTAKSHCLHFKILNIDLMSYCILINFTNIQWLPDMFCKLPVVYQQINYIYCMHIEMLPSLYTHG